jgi:hypothetical protein
MFGAGGKNLRMGDGWRAVAFAFLAVISGVVWLWVLGASFGACVVGSTTESLQKTVEALDETANYTITWSVTIIGASTAILLGLKSGLRLTPWSKSLLLICSIFFGQAAAAGVYWKLRVANSWLNRCLNLIYEPSIAFAFDAMLYFLGLGLFCALLLVCVAAWTMSPVGGPHEPH